MLVLMVPLIMIIVLPTLARIRLLSMRTICAANLKGLGTGLHRYASDNDGTFPVAAHPPAETDRRGLVDYTRAIGSYRGRADDPDAGNTFQMLPPPDRLSTTRNMWTLVRTGASSAKQFICPPSFVLETDEQVRQAMNTAEPHPRSYWDFGSGDITGPATAAQAKAGWAQVSYGYQVPYGRLGRPSTDRDPGTVLMADKGPFGAAIDGRRKLPPPITASATDSPKAWRPWNSPNHGGEGQTVLFADVHVEFLLKPTVGLKNDNIYTQWGTTGDDALDREQGNRPTAGGRETPADDDDTLIYP